MITAMRLSVFVAISCLVLFGLSYKAQAAKQKEIRVEGVIAECDLEASKIKVKDIKGEIHNLVLNKATVVVAGNRKVSRETLKSGLKAIVWYREEKQPPVSGIGVPILMMVKRIELEPSVKVIHSSVGERFIDNRDGTITDKKTNLMWQKTDNSKKVTFEEAEKYCQTLRLGGHADWKLPNKDEKDAEVVDELMMHRHSSNEQADFYWASDPSVLLSFNYPAPHIIISNAYDVKKGAKAFVRAVRSLEAPRPNSDHSLVQLESSDASYDTKQKSEDELVLKLKKQGIERDRFRIPQILPRGESSARMTVKGSKKETPFGVEQSASPIQLYPKDTELFSIRTTSGGWGMLPTGNGSIWCFIGPYPFSIEGYSFEGDKSDPLTFLLLEKKGLIYLHGKGKVVNSQGKEIKLGFGN